MSGRVIVRIKGLRLIWNTRGNIWRGRKKKVAARQVTIRFYAIRERIAFIQKRLTFWL